MTPDELVRSRKADWERLTSFADRARGSRLAGLAESELLELGRLYRSATSDLAIAQRDFPQHDVARYLNQLVGTTHGLVYGGEPLILKRLKRFYWNDLPALYWAQSRYIGLSALLFLGSAVVTFFAIAAFPEAAPVIMTPDIIEKVRSGEKWWKELNEANQVGASVIMTNNLRVAFMAFAGGMLLGALTVYILIANGISIGGIFGLLQANGNAQPLAEFVIGHGVLEIIEIIIAGGCGLMLGHALLQPGLLTRANALSLAAQKSIKLLLGSAPLLVIAGLIEGFISPSDTIPWAVKIAIGIGSGLALLAYLIVRGRAQPGATARPVL